MEVIPNKCLRQLHKKRPYISKKIFFCILKHQNSQVRSFNYKYILHYTQRDKYLKYICIDDIYVSSTQYFKCILINDLP